MHATSTNTHFTDTHPQDHSCQPTSNPLLPDLRATIIHTSFPNLGTTHPSLSTPGAHFTSPPHITHPSAHTLFYIHTHEPHHPYSYSWRNHIPSRAHTLSLTPSRAHTLSLTPSDWRESDLECSTLMAHKSIPEVLMPMLTDKPKATSDIKMTHEWRDMNNHGTVSTVVPLPSHILAHSRPTLAHRNKWWVSQCCQ